MTTANHHNLESLVIQQVHDSIVATDMEGYVTLWNPGAERMFGYTADEMLGQHISCVYPPEKHEFLKNEVIGPLLHQGQHEVEVHMEGKHGRAIIALLRLSLLHDETGRAVGMVGFSFDITPHKLAEEARLESEARFRAIFESVDDGLVIFDREDRILFINQKAISLVGCYTREEMLGRTPAEIFWNEKCVPRAQVLKWLEQIDTVWGSGESVELEETIGFNLQVFNKRVFPIRDARERIIAVGAIYRDLTVQRKLEHELRERQEKLDRVTRLTELEGMSSALAHELNQPLAATLGYLRRSQVLLRRGEMTGEQLEEALSGAIAQSERAATLVWRVRGMAGRSPARPERFDVNALIDEIVPLFAVNVAKAGIMLWTRLQADLPKVEGDPLQIEQVVVNLVRNAIEAVDGRPLAEIAVTTEPCGAGQGVMINVTDNGPGIEPRILGEVFQPFFTTKPGGLGLGLAISRSIVEGSGGRISVNTPPSGGTRFSVCLHHGKHAGVCHAHE